MSDPRAMKTNLAIDVVCMLLVIATIAGSTLYVIQPTGPGCPNMDPDWLGRCEASQ